jgi:hypothetical protein
MGDGILPHLPFRSPDPTLSLVFSNGGDLWQQSPSEGS